MADEYSQELMPARECSAFPLRISSNGQITVSANIARLSGVVAAVSCRQTILWNAESCGAYHFNNPVGEKIREY